MQQTTPIQVIIKSITTIYVPKNDTKQIFFLFNTKGGGSRAPSEPPLDPPLLSYEATNAGSNLLVLNVYQF